MALRQDSEDGVELSEKIVLTRTRAPDLDSVKKLNCWASNISDVSVVRKLPNLEVCSLSINRIATLRDFAHCYKLKELYVRTNRIHCLGDIHYLKNLSRLRYLWLSENPCAEAENYRLTVLKTLPRLQKLDNTAVTYEEVQEALSTADEIPIPDDFSASSMFNRPLDISYASSVSSISAISMDGDGVLSPRFSNAGVNDSNTSPREELPVARKKREQRRMRKADEDTARRSAEEEFVRTSMERKKNRVGRNDEDDSCESVSDDLKSSTDSESGGSIKKSPLLEGVNDDDVVSAKHLVVGSCSSGDDKKKDEGGGDEGEDKQNSCGSVQSVSNENVKSDVVEEKEDCSNIKDNNSNAHDRKEIILNNDEEKDDDNNCNNNNNNDKLCENQTEGNGECSIHDASKNENNNIKMDVNINETGDSLLDKIRLDDSLAVDDEDERGDPSRDSIDLDDLIVEIGEENQTLTNKNGCNNNDKATQDDDDKNKSAIRSTENSVKNQNQPTTTNHRLNDVSTTASSSPRSGSDSDDKTTSVPQKDSIDWEQYNRMRQDIGMKPMERGTTSARPLTANVARARNGNILQAVLSLVKELDKESLDLVSSAVKARIDSL